MRVQLKAAESPAVSTMGYAEDVSDREIEDSEERWDEDTQRSLEAWPPVASPCQTD